MSELRLDWTNRGQTFKVEIGDIISVSLWGNGTTGFFWSPLAASDSPLDEINDHEIEPPSGSVDADRPTVLGSGASQETMFRASRPGSQELKFRYWRGVEAVEDVIYQVTIMVHEGIP